MSSTKPGDQLSSSSRQDVSEPRIDLSKPRYDQSTYGGRVRHFFETTNPANALVTCKQLEEAANLVKAYKYVFSETILVHEHTHTHSLSPSHSTPSHRHIPPTTQKWRSSSWYNNRAALEGKASLRFSVSPGHWAENVPSGSDVLPGSC